MAPKTICKIPDCCNGGRIKRDMCPSHYQRWKKHGDPLGGRVTITKPGKAKKWLMDHVHHKGDGCLIWPFSKFHDGTGQAWHKGKKQIASRLMCTMAHGDPPTPKHEAAHSCGRGKDACVHPDHLRWATSLENHAEMIDHGNSTRGEKHPGAVLKVEQVIEIRKLAKSMTHKAIADKFGVVRSTISDIVHRRNWSWL